MKKLLFFVLLFLCFPVWADLLDDRVAPLHTFLKHYHVSSVLFVMVLTAVIETFLLWCFKYHGWKILSYFFILNLISNFLVNYGAEVLPEFFIEDDVYFYRGRIEQLYYYCIPFLELFVVVFEASFLGLMTGYNRKLWISVFLTNLISFLTGIFLFGL